MAVRFDPLGPRARSIFWTACAMCAAWTAIAVLAAPTPIICRSDALSSAAIATLKNLAYCQQEFASQQHRDVDCNGTGEFGDFQQLARAKIWGVASDPGAARYRFTAHGYHYRLVLPETVHARERAWVCYAWPVATDGERNAYATGTDGDVVMCAEKSYGGPNEAPTWAAFAQHDPEEWLTWPLAQNERALDGANWYLVN